MAAWRSWTGSFPRSPDPSPLHSGVDRARTAPVYSLVRFTRRKQIKKSAQEGDKLKSEGSGAGRLRSLSNRLLSTQLLIALGVSAVALVFGVVPGYSALLGGLVSLVSNAYFARKVFADKGSPLAGRVVLVFYWAEIVKITMAAVLIAALCMLIKDINVMALVAGFFVVHVGGVLSLGPRIGVTGEGVPPRESLR